MWRTRAVTSLLIEEVAALRLPEEEREEGAETDHPAAGQRELDEARRKARAVIALDWVAIAALFAIHARPLPFLGFGALEDAVFTGAVLAVAVHSGFRLGQLEKYSAVSRAVAELAERDPEG